MTDESGDLITLLEACELAGRKIGTVRGWLHTGRLAVARRELRGGSWVALVRLVVATALEKLERVPALRRLHEECR